MVNQAKVEKLASFLRSHHALRIHECVMADKRVDAFKGTTAVKALLSPEYAKLAHRNQLPAVKTPEDVSTVMELLLSNGMILRARSNGQGKVLQPDLSRSWSEEALYVWIYEGSQWRLVAGSVGLLVLVFACMMFPLWPSVIRSKASFLLNMGMYGGIGIMIFLLVLSIVRMIVYLITYFTMKAGLWIFPNLWADCGVLESFVPVWDWDRPLQGDQSATSKNGNETNAATEGMNNNGRIELISESINNDSKKSN